jgi:hypothetical protein
MPSSGIMHDRRVRPLRKSKRFLLIKTLTFNTMLDEVAEAESWLVVASKLKSLP